VALVHVYRHGDADAGRLAVHRRKGQDVPALSDVSASVDHDGDRYGFVRNLKSPQDEVNHRRSKALHLLNSRRVVSEKGAVDDIEVARTRMGEA
jgi:hypothetical protein